MGMKLQHHPACRNKLHEAIRDRVTVPFDGSFTALNFFQKLLNTASIITYKFICKCMSANLLLN